MNRDLTGAEIDDVLQSQIYGHLACTLPDHRIYVVPITFAYHHEAIYCFSFHGLKIDTLRKSPFACFQTEQFLHENIWRSVICWGTYEEISHAEQLSAAKIIFKRLEREQGMALSPLYQPPARALLPPVEMAMKEKEAIFYRIRIEQKTGKHVQYD